MDCARNYRIISSKLSYQYQIDSRGNTNFTTSNYARQSFWKFLVNSSLLHQSWLQYVMQIWPLEIPAFPHGFQCGYMSYRLKVFWFFLNFILINVSLLAGAMVISIHSLKKNKWYNVMIRYLLLKFLVFLWCHKL